MPTHALTWLNDLPHGCYRRPAMFRQNLMPVTPLAMGERTCLSLLPEERRGLGLFGTSGSEEETAAAVPTQHTCLIY